MLPIWTAGYKLEWKKVQKKEKKNITSEIMKRNIPYFKLVWTSIVWWPSKVPSRITSRNHKQAEINKTIRLKLKKEETPVWNQSTALEVKNNKHKEHIKGHGLLSTIWKKCWFLNSRLDIKILIICNKIE